VIGGQDKPGPQAHPSVIRSDGTRKSRRRAIVLAKATLGKYARRRQTAHIQGIDG